MEQIAVIITVIQAVQSILNQGKKSFHLWLNSKSLHADWVSATRRHRKVLTKQVRSSNFILRVELS